MSDWQACAFWGALLAVGLCAVGYVGGLDAAPALFLLIVQSIVVA